MYDLYLFVVLIRSGYLVKQLMPALSLCLFENIAHIDVYKRQDLL